MKVSLLSVLFVAASLRFSAHARPDPCPHGWSYRSGACYRVVNKDTADFKIAQKYCRYIGGEVVKITSKEENNYVLDLAQTFAPNLTKLWIAIQRDYDNNELYWTDGTELTYSNWMDGQPDDYDGEEDCANLYLTSGEREGLWNDRPCYSPDEKLAFMCQKECQPGWSYFDGKCYMIGSENAGWQDARQKCAAHGADLVKITSGDENDFITSSGAKYAEGKYRLWIGLHRDLNKELKWTDGTTTRYSNWREGQPDNFCGKENCVHLYLSGSHKSKWNDNSCVLEEPSEAGYACEKDDGYIKTFK